MQLYLPSANRDIANARISPDGRWVAYQSAESGRTEVYAKPFEGEGKWHISTGGGGQPRWSANSAEIFYLGLDGTLMVATVQKSGTELKPSLARALFHARPPSNYATYDVSRDGQRILVAVPEAAPAITPITVLVNWTALVK